MNIDKYLLVESKNQIYFGHPEPTYNTKYEKNGIESIQKEFPNYKVINPNQVGNQEKYKTLGFDMFFDMIDTCDFCVFMTALDGRWGVGIYEEAYYCHKSGKKVYQLDPHTGDITIVDNPITLKYYELGLTKKGEVKRRIK